MPCANISVSVKLTEAQKEAVVKKATKILADVIRKPISYCMATLTELAAGAMGDSTEPIAFVRVGSIGGLNPSVNEKLSAGFCTMLNKELGIDAGRIYLNFEVFSGSNWGFNGSTF